MAAFFSFYEETSGRSLTINVAQICSLHLDDQGRSVVRLANGDEHTLCAPEAALLDKRIAEIEHTYRPAAADDLERERD